MNVREELRHVDELKAGDLIRYITVNGHNILLSVIRCGTSAKLVTLDSNGEIKIRTGYHAKSELWVLVYLKT